MLHGVVLAGSGNGDDVETVFVGEGKPLHIYVGASNHFGAFLAIDGFERLLVVAFASFHLHKGHDCIFSGYYVYFNRIAASPVALADDITLAI